jgi:hypothetical protein
MKDHDRRRRIAPALLLLLVSLLVCPAASARVETASAAAPGGVVAPPRDAAGLLKQFAPVLRYDAHELFYADSPAVATDNPEVTLHADGPSGPVIAGRGSPISLSLSYLGARRYADGRAAGRDDTLVGPSGGYAAAAGLAMQMHAQAQYANVIYGRLAHGSDGRWYLQYWCFFLYNHAPYGNGIGDHWGDWKVIQLRLDPTGLRPDLAQYEQHKGLQAKPLEAVTKAAGGAERPVVYVANGSHALEDAPGWRFSWQHFGPCGAAPDRTDGRVEVSPTLELLDTQPWAAWPGRYGQTRARNPLMATSPPGPAGHAVYHDPAAPHASC